MYYNWIRFCTNTTIVYIRHYTIINVYLRESQTIALRNCSLETILFLSKPILFRSGTESVWKKQTNVSGNETRM